jgi:hypothetical protein
LWGFVGIEGDPMSLAATCSFIGVLGWMCCVEIGGPYFPVRMGEPSRWSSVAALRPPDDDGYIQTIKDVQRISPEW